MVAACLLNGRFGLSDLVSEALADPAVRLLASRVACHSDPDNAFTTFFSGGVTVHLRDGRTFARHVRVNSGAGERAMEPDAVIAKFMASATLAVSNERARSICDLVLSLEASSVRGLTALLRADA